MPVFYGGRFQRGYGLGSLFWSLARRALPFLHKGAQSVGRAALKTGADIAQDVILGKPFKASAQSRLKQTASDLKDQALNQFLPQTGSGRGKPLKNNPAKKTVSSLPTVEGKASPRTRKRKQKVPEGVVKRSKVKHLDDIWEK